MGEQYVVDLESETRVKTRRRPYFNFSLLADICFNPLSSAPRSLWACRRRALCRRPLVVSPPLPPVAWASSWAMVSVALQVRVLVVNVFNVSYSLAPSGASTSRQ